MIECDCGNSRPVETLENVVCSNCGVVLDALYEKELSHKQVSHLANPIIGDIHPTINRTLSELSVFIDMRTKTRLNIIDRAYQLYDSSINYVIATKYAFMEQFPDIEIDINKKTMKKIEKIKQNHSECDDKCRGNCAKLYRNKYMLKKINNLNNIVENGKKKKRRIEDILQTIKLSKSRYYEYKNGEFIHLPKLSIPIEVTKKSKTKITRRIHEHIKENKKSKLSDLRAEILLFFRVDLNLSTIWRHIKKIENEEFK